MRAIRDYTFTSKNMGDVIISVSGEYRDGCWKDVSADIGRGGYKEWLELDDADEIMQWLVDQGVEFAGDRSMAFNRAYIQNVLIERDMTEEELLDEAAAWSDGDIAMKLQSIDR